MRAAQVADGSLALIIAADGCKSMTCATFSRLPPRGRLDLVAERRRIRIRTITGVLEVAFLVPMAI
jgi:hypothetical protein